MTPEDIDSARDALTRAGLWEMVSTMLGGFTLEQVLEEVRTPPRLNRLRFEMWYVAYERRDTLGRRMYSYTELGILFNRDHTTIIGGVKKHHAAVKQANG